MLKKQYHRRTVLRGLATGVAAALLYPEGAMAFLGKTNRGKDFPFQLTDAQWREKLAPEAYDVLRKHDTERAFSSPLNNEKRNGSYNCKGCGQKVFSSEHKFDSGTGWPSFWKPVDEKAVGTSTDYKLILPRTEVHCANCGGHLGHVFDDGPPPTGLRYCMNGAAMEFVPAKAE